MFSSFFKSTSTCLAISAVCTYTSLAHSIQSEIIPSLKEDAWTILSYNNIPSNQVTFSDSSLAVKVKHSAGPIVYKLGPPKKIFQFEIKGKISGVKKIETGSFDEDSTLRLGLVAIGDQTLTGPKKWFAADWVKKLFSLAPAGVGLDKIYFFNVTNRSDLNGKKRVHPKSNLIVETVFSQNNTEGTFNFVKKLDSPIDTVAIWLSIDGDDTKSEYETVISEIKLTVTQ